MRASSPRPRPWFAALTSLGLSGLGHCYLHEWRRAALWLGLALTAALLFVPESAVVALADSGTPPGVRALAPVLVIRLFAVLDAYRMADAKNCDELDVSCPSCGKPIDVALDFCPWCTERFAADEEEPSSTSR